MIARGLSVHYKPMGFQPIVFSKVEKALKKLYKKFENKKLTIDKQIVILNKINIKIKNILKRRFSDARQINKNKKIYYLLKVLESKIRLKIINLKIEKCENEIKINKFGNNVFVNEQEEYNKNKEKFNMYNFQNYTYDLTIIFKKDLRTKIVCKKEVKNGEELQIRQEDDICNSFSLFPAFMSASNFSFNETYNFPEKYNSFFKTEIIISNFKLSNIDEERNNNFKKLKKLYKELDMKALALEKDFNNFCDIVETQYTNENIKNFGLLGILNSDVEGKESFTFHFDSSNNDETKRIDGLYKMFCASYVIDDEGNKEWKREKFNVKEKIDKVFDIIDYEENYIFPKKNDLLLRYIKKLKNILGKIKFESSFLKDGKYFKKVNINFGVGTYIFEFNDYIFN